MGSVSLHHVCCSSPQPKSPQYREVWGCQEIAVIGVSFVLGLLTWVEHPYGGATGLSSQPMKVGGKGAAQKPCCRGLLYPKPSKYNFVDIEGNTKEDQSKSMEIFKHSPLTTHYLPHVLMYHNSSPCFSYFQPVNSEKFGFNYHLFTS